MDTSELKAKIIACLKEERDPTKLGTILRLLDRSEQEWSQDGELVSTVMEAEAEYAAGKAIPLETAREMAKRSASK
jgi:hypothetical protein